MKRGQIYATIVSGLFAGLLYTAASGALDSLLLIYTPFFPLLLLGLSSGVPTLIYASLLGALLSGLLISPNAALVFLMLFAAPSLIFIRQLLSILRTPAGDIWLPAGEGLTRVTLYVVTTVIFLTFAIFDVTQQQGMHALFPPAEPGEPAWMEIARQILAEKTHIILGGTAWLQISIFYGIAVFANFMLSGYRRNIRPNLTLLPFVAGPEVLIFLLSAGVLAVTASDPALILAARAAFIALLFPYFLMGISRMHFYSLLWPNRRFWLTIVYFLMLLGFPFFALGFIGIGLAAQARHLSNRFMGEPGQTS